MNKEHSFLLWDYLQRVDRLKMDSRKGKGNKTSKIRKYFYFIENSIPRCLLVLETHPTNNN